eukprot:gene10954-16845_t
MAPLQRILVANRGEIARRVIRACKKLGIQSVAVFTDVDRDMPHVAEATTSYRLGPDPQGYLNPAALIRAAHETQSEAVHPGYGFLSENSAFARAVEAAGLVFIGPTSATIDEMGSKIAAKRALQGVAPMIPGGPIDPADVAGYTRLAGEVGYPVLIKASAGGGGRGISVVACEEDLEAAVNKAVSEGERAFGDGAVLLEKFVEAVKHVEVQIFGDARGNATHFFERECSAQRRHQKVIEESPSPFLSASDRGRDLRKKLCETAAGVAHALRYRNAGTVEFIVDPATYEYYFLEVNTRLQVEHTVTELTSNTDLVALQILVAEGLGLPAAVGRCVLDAARPAFRLPADAEGCILHGNLPQGHAVQARLYAEDINLQPTVGTVAYWGCGSELIGRAGPRERGLLRADDEQAGRSDSLVAYHDALCSGAVISIYYDNMISKVVAYDPDTREAALRRTCRALANAVCFGLTTNKLFLLSLLKHPDFSSSPEDGASRITTRWIEKNLQGLQRAAVTHPHLLTTLAVAQAAAAAALLRGAGAAPREHLRHIPGGWTSNLSRRARPKQKHFRVLRSTHGILPALGSAAGGDDVLLVCSVTPGPTTGDQDSFCVRVSNAATQEEVASFPDMSVTRVLPGDGGSSVAFVAFGPRVIPFTFVSHSTSECKVDDLFISSAESGLEISLDYIPALLLPATAACDEPTT